MTYAIVVTTVELDDSDDNPFRTDNYCRECGDAIHEPDPLTGVIHKKNNLYACWRKNEVTGKIERLSTVAAWR